MLYLHDFEAAARRRLPRPLFGFVSGASEDNSSLADNRRAFDEYGFTTQVLCDVADRSASVELFGRHHTSAFGIAPMGIVALSGYRGDLAMAQAAAAAGIVSVMSASSLIPMEAVARQSPGTWFQAYLPGSAERIHALADRVAAAGFETLVVTVDAHIAANRENNLRAGFSTPLKPGLRLARDGIVRPRWTFGAFLRTLLTHGMPHFENSLAERGAPIVSSSVLRDFSARDHLGWPHLEEIRKRWKGPLVVKGILGVADTLQARAIGADGVILSNHAGRQLDGAISPLRLLPRLVDAIGTDWPVMIDGGFRRGTDVLKAVALGARLAYVGRPFNYALAVAGESGVAHAIGLPRSEILRDIGMLGANNLAALSREFLHQCRQVLRSKISASEVSRSC